MFTEWLSRIDWSATGAMLQGIGTSLGAITVLAAAIIGSNTFKSWRRQKLSERRIEQAERILTATYRCRRALSRVRSPAMMGYELDDAEALLKEQGNWDRGIGENEKQRLAKTQAYYTRLNQTRDDQRALEECQPMARALFGEDLERAIEILNRQFWTVKVYVDANNDRHEADKSLRRKIDSTIYEGYPSTDENEIDQTIVAQVKIIEDRCVPILRLD